jgi:hypothetical protein
MSKGPSAAVLLRQLFREMSKLMPEQGTFKEIAGDFYEVGIIDAPEDPWNEGTYEYKAPYVLDRLNEAYQSGKDLEDFLRVTVPRVVFNADLEGGSWSLDPVERLLRQLGYYKDPEDEAVKHGVRSYTPPDTFPFPTARADSSAQTSSRRIDIEGLPKDVQELVDELEDCLARKNRNAAALLTRKIIHKAIFIAMSRQEKADLLKTDTGDDVELSTALGRCASECGVSRQVVSRVTSAKWIGDTANHSYRMKVTDGDLDTAVTGVRLFLAEVL